jgi:DNA integrity scanning protein DisA with diadenylate cyclase activity
MEFYSFVHPRAATFVFNEQGKFEGCLELLSRRQGDPKDPQLLMKALVGRFDPGSLMFFVLNRGTQTIRIYGDTEGDIYLQEDTGYWIKRSHRDLVKWLRIPVEQDPGAVWHTIELTLERAWQLAPERTGAILVVANTYPSEITHQTVLATPINLDGCSEIIFSDFARKDGAVWINWSAMIERTGVIVGSVAEDPNKENRLGGARHGAARSISKDVKGSFVFVVSQNGGISAFHDGVQLFYRA